MEMRKYTLFFFALEVCLSVTMTGILKITVYPDQMAFSDLLCFKLKGILNVLSTINSKNQAKKKFQNGPLHGNFGKQTK